MKLAVTAAMLRTLYVSYVEDHDDWRIVLAPEGYGVEPGEVTGPSVLAAFDLHVAMIAGWSDEIADELAATFPVIPAEQPGADPETADGLVVVGAIRPNGVDLDPGGWWWTDRAGLTRIDDTRWATAGGRYVCQHESRGWWLEQTQN